MSLTAEQMQVAREAWDKAEKPNPSGWEAVYAVYAAALTESLELIEQYRELTRDDYISTGGGDRDEIPEHCHLCERSWHPMDDREDHAPGCLCALPQGGMT